MLVRQKGEAEWSQPESGTYTNEAALQALLEESPHLLPGTDGRLAVASELSLPDGSAVDLIGVDRSGRITIVECKLQANSEIRRTIVGQILAYAATLWQLLYEILDDAFRARTGESLAQRVATLAGAEPWDEVAFRDSVAAKLEAGSFRLIIAVDAITDELKRIVQYLNEHTLPEVQVLALELRYVAHAGVEILQAVNYGEESVRTKSAKLRRPQEKGLALRELAQRSPAGAQAVQHLLDFSEQRGGTVTEGSGSYPSMGVWLPNASGKPALSWHCYVYSKTPAIDIGFGDMRGKLPEGALARLAARLRAIPGAESRFAGLEEHGFRTYPSLPIDAVVAIPGVVEMIEAAFAEALAQS